MNADDGQFKSVWRKGETPPQHVVDRAVNDIARERRETTEGLIRLLETGKLPNNPVINAVNARNATAHAGPVDAYEERPISGAQLSRANHFANTVLEYTNKWHENELPKGYWDKTSGEENTPDYPKDINWGNK